MSLELSIENNSFLRGIFLEGEKKGEKKGIKLGEKLGKASLLQRQLELRFGKLPKWATQRLETADAITLEQWGERIFDARKLEEIIPKPRATRSRIKR